ncbi:MAG: FKBP-type peptidyl-prolyl cis-trans isomerase [Planctomycetes bacterium]|nr:FKBP-type peptidyl-prolyl cis-trans isomerase [Planctomycetota bacterium]
MKKSIPFLLCATFLFGLWVGQVPAQDGTPTPAPGGDPATKARRGYALGYQLSNRFRRGLPIKMIDIDSVGKGFADGIRGTPSISETEVLETVNGLRVAMIKDQIPAGVKQDKALEGAARDHKKSLDGLLVRSKGEEFLAEIAKKEGVKKTKSGLYYKVLTQGKGTTKPTPTETVTVHYVGKLIDGTEFDSSVKRGQPANFPLNRVIPGWTEGLQLMVEGSKFEFYIPFELAYGPEGKPPTIPRYATLVFQVELIKIGK